MFRKGGGGMIGLVQGRNEGALGGGGGDVRHTLR